MKRAGISIVVLLLLVAGIGCGGDDDGGDGTTIARADYVKQAEAICANATQDREAAVNDALKASEAGGGEPPQERQLLALVMEAALPSVSQMTDELRQLGVPDSDAEQAEAMVDAFATAVAEVEADPEAFAQGRDDPFDEATDLAAELQIETCVIP